MKRYIALGALVVLAICCFEPATLRLHDERFLAETVDVFIRTWKVRMSEIEEIRMRWVVR